MLEHLIENPFTEFGLIFVVVFVITAIMRLFKQPFIIGFIIAGIIFSPALLGINVDLTVSAQLGVVLLLFIAGLHLNPYYLKADGKAIIVAGLSQIAVTTTGGYLLANLFGFTGLEAVIMAVCLTLSSTIITLKMIADRKQTTNLYARLSIGILLIQDVFVALAIVALNAAENPGGGSVAGLILRNIALAVVILVPAILFQRYLLPKLLNSVAKSQEYLFVFVISWMLLFAGIFEVAGFSLEVGALVAGVLLASSAFAPEISAKISPLRDFFLIIFFVNLGTSIDFSNMHGLILPIIGFSAFVLIIKPIAVTLIFTALGFTGKLAGRTALSLSHVSEFSLILVAIGRASNLISSEAAVVITLVALITIAISTYMITYDQWVIAKLHPILAKVERKHKRKSGKNEEKMKPDMIVIGAKRGGWSIIQSLQKLKKNFIVIDFNPEVIKKLEIRGIECIFGDISNLYHLDEVDFGQVKYVVSTTTDNAANLAALQFFKSKIEHHIEYLCYANDDQDAIQLYENGASYVLVPHHVGGKFVSTLIEAYEQSPEELLKHKLSHIEHLKEGWTQI